MNDRKPKDNGIHPASPSLPIGGAALRHPGFYLFALGLTILVYALQSLPLFWDTVQLAGKHASFYYSGDFGRWLLPPALDSGHPPTFGLYLAACWKLFGRSLPVSHWAMYPWLLLWLFGVWRVLRAWVPVQWLPWSVLILLIDPVWLGQAALVSPDIWVMVGFWWALAGMQEGRAGWLVLATVLLCLTSTRGMMLSAALYGIALRWRYRAGERRLTLIWRTLLPFLPGAMAGVGFLIWHYTQAGWIGYHAGSPWAPSFERVGVKGLLRNIAVLGWRLVDYGRWVVFPLLGVGVVFFWKKESTAFRVRFAKWGSVLLVLLLFLAPTTLLYKGLSGHRYWLPMLQWLLVGALIVITHLKFSFLKKMVYSVLMLSLLTGHLWVYPRAISQQWDATLLHVAYARLRQQAFDHLDRRQIPYADVATVFPEIGPRDLRELNGRPDGLVPFTEKRTPYIWYSNVMNDYPDAVLARFQRYPVEARWNSLGVELVLYRRPD